MKVPKPKPETTRDIIREPMSPPAPVFDHRIFVRPPTDSQDSETHDKVVNERVARSNSREKVESEDATVTSSSSAVGAAEEDDGIQVLKVATSNSFEDTTNIVDDEKPGNVSFDNLFDIHAGTFTCSVYIPSGLSRFWLSFGLDLAAYLLLASTI